MKSVFSSLNTSSSLGRIIPMILLLAAGCSVGPNYHRPAVTAPDNFRGSLQKTTNSLADLPWEQVFPDPTLQELIRISLTNNYDVRIAVTRVEQARQMEKEARAQFWPQVNYSAGLGRGRNVSANNTLTPGGATGGIFYGDVNAAWDIDIWGRIRRLSESAKAQFLATDEARRDVTEGLIAEVAQSYFQLLALDRELQIARDTTNSFSESLRIFSERLKGGVASRLETSSAAALLASAAATIPQLEQQIALQENQIRVLLAQNPGPIVRTNTALDSETLPDVPAGLPSSLLERRPDVREAELNLRSANAQVGVAVANFFPQISLTGLVGQVSPELSAITSGGANAWSVAAGLTGPLFQGGLLRAQHNQALAARDQYALQYKQTVLYAFQQVSDALISLQQLADVRVEQARAVSAYQEAATIAMQRYQLGQSSYYEVLQQQQLLFPAENTLVQTQLSQLVTGVQLYHALGGGWQATTNVPPPRSGYER